MGTVTQPSSPLAGKSLLGALLSEDAGWHEESHPTIRNLRVCGCGLEGAQARVHTERFGGVEFQVRCCGESGHLDQIAAWRALEDAQAVTQQRQEVRGVSVKARFRFEVEQ